MTWGEEFDAMEREELRLQARHERRMRHTMARHPDPRDPDHPEPDDDVHQRTCLSCFGRFPVQADGTPVGGALPCGH